MGVLLDSEGARHMYVSGCISVILDIAITVIIECMSMIIRVLSLPARS